jgi:GT2 family glycosyltransferase
MAAARAFSDEVGSGSSRENATQQDSGAPTRVTRVETRSDARVSVIIPHLDDLAGLRACIARLEAQTLPRHRFEIVVADNGSKASLAEIEAAALGARVIRVAERGAGPARNGGVAASRHEVIAFTDSDCMPEPGWLAAGLGALETADLAGGGVTVSVPDPARPTPAEAFEVVFAFDNRSYVETKGFSVTANLFTTRAVFDAVGGFRTHVPEDLDWCRRARLQGYRIAYASDAIVAHPARRSWAELRRKWRRLTNEAMALDRETGQGTTQAALEAIAVALSPLAHAATVLRTEKLGLAAKLAALGILFRLRLLRAWWLLAELIAPAETRA